MSTQGGNQTQTTEVITPWRDAIFCTKGGARTHTLLLASDFESDVSTSSTTLAIKTTIQKNS